MSRWDVYRDKAGNPVTITEEQGHAIWHAIRTWRAVWRKEHGDEAPFNDASLSKSCLLGRMLFQGRAPLDEAPPLRYSAPAYHLVDPDLCPYCAAPWDEPGRNLLTSIDQKLADTLMSLVGWDSPDPAGAMVLQIRCAEDRHARRVVV